MEEKPIYTYSKNVLQKISITGRPRQSYSKGFVSEEFGDKDGEGRRHGGGWSGRRETVRRKRRMSTDGCKIFLDQHFTLWLI